ncbi:MAG: hypothetical protein ACFWUE_00240 [Xylanivirga thermophila]|jgi:hypothetical protein
MGYVDFENVIKISLFNSEIKRIKDGFDKVFNIALICTEKVLINCQSKKSKTKRILQHINIY